MSRALLIPFVCLVSTLPAVAQEGGIEIFAGETLFQDGYRVSFTELFTDRSTLFAGSNDISDPLDRSMTEARSVVGIDYGLNPDVTLSMLAPYVSKRFESGGMSTRAAGFGDVALIGKLRLDYEHWAGGGWSWAVIGGLEVPTGNTGERDGGVRVAPNLQPGNGAWNPFVAAAFTYDRHRARFDATLLYKLNTEGSRRRVSEPSGSGSGTGAGTH